MRELATNAATSSIPFVKRQMAIEPGAAQDGGNGGKQRNKSQHHVLIQRVPERVAENRSLDQERADERTGVD